MWFIFGQGFAGVFPWNVITYFFFDYLAKERGYDENAVLFTMVPMVLILACRVLCRRDTGRLGLQEDPQRSHHRLKHAV